MQFSPRKLHFGDRAKDDDADQDEGAGLPTPRLLKLRARRAAGIHEARDVLAHLPEPGESLHAIVTARLDLCDILAALLPRLGPCDRMLIATLGYNRRNFRSMLHWLDSGTVGSLALVASKFFYAHNGELWAETQEELAKRGCRSACVPSHAKVICMAFASGAKMVCEGSANLCGSGSAREQFALINDPAIHDFHAGWIADLLDRHAGK
jgi:hypothetical protein